MKRFIIASLASLLLASGAGLAAEPAPAAKSPPKADAAKPSAPVAAKGDPRSASGSVKPVIGSQQNRMRECNKSATGKKGAERKAFMKTCLSTRKG